MCRVTLTVFRIAAVDGPTAGGGAEALPGVLRYQAQSRRDRCGVRALSTSPYFARTTLGYNTVIVVAPDGASSRTRKVHLP
jgi:hypothetical protein